MPYKDKEKQAAWQREKYYAARKALVKQRTDEFRKKNHLFILEYLETHPCIDCGEDDPIVLEFDHVRGEKIKSIAQLVKGNTIDKIQQEIEKCEVVCANCHRRRTAKRGNWMKLSLVV